MNGQLESFDQQRAEQPPQHIDIHLRSIDLRFGDDIVTVSVHPWKRADKPVVIHVPSLLDKESEQSAGDIYAAAGLNLNPASAEIRTSGLDLGHFEFGGRRRFVEGFRHRGRVRRGLLIHPIDHNYRERNCHGIEAKPQFLDRVEERDGSLNGSAVTN
ncbi:MAG TPA: hypothetical protein VH640_10445 [Bryobacteraceae bacterium]